MSSDDPDREAVSAEETAAAQLLVFMFLVMLRAPLTLDPSAWYPGRSFAALLFFASALFASFLASLGGKPLFGKAVLED